MSMKAREIGDWLRQAVGKRNHREVLSEGDYFVLRPGPNFDWLMGNLAAGQPTPSEPGPNPTGNDGHEDDPRRQFLP